MLAVAVPTVPEDRLARPFVLRPTERARRLPSKASRRLRETPSPASPPSAPPQKIFHTRIAADRRFMPEARAAPGDRRSISQAQPRGGEKTPSESGMAGGSRPPSPSSHRDPAAFTSSAVEQRHSSLGAGITRASQGVAFPQSVATADGDEVAGGAASHRPKGEHGESPVAQSDQPHHHRPSLFSTATATTPISFSSHPALQPHGPPFRYDAGGGVNPGAGFMNETWTDYLQLPRHPQADENAFLPEGLDFAAFSAFSDSAPFDLTQPSGMMGYGANTDPSMSGSSTDPSRNNSITSTAASTGSMAPLGDLPLFPPFPLTAQPSPRADDPSWANGYLPLPVLASLIASANSTQGSFPSSPTSTSAGASARPSAGRAAATSAGLIDAGGPSSGSSAPPNARADSGTSDDRSRSGSGAEGSGSRTGRDSHSGNGTSRLPGTGGNDDGSDSDGEGQGGDSGKRKRDQDSSGGKKLVQRADKSCRKCRERRVRCDRLWPACERCHKRRERCVWAEGTNVDEVEEGGDAERIASLQNKVAYLERQLKAAQSGRQNSQTGSGSGSGSGSAAPIDLPAAGKSERSVQQVELGRERLPLAASPSAEPTLAASIWTTIRDIWALRMNLDPEETNTLLQYLAAQTCAPYAGQLELGRGNIHWRLAEPLMAKVLTIHLLDAAVRACCSRLPGIQPLALRIEQYKRNLDKLSPAEECAVAVLAALGARASPHSQLLGIDTLCLADGTPSPPLFLYAGERREMACRQLEARARELCWSHGFFEHLKIEQLDSAVGLVQLLIYEEIRPKQSRYFARSALGLYFDIRYNDLENGNRTSSDPRIGPGAALFLADATIAAACSRPSFISTTELDQYIVTDGVHIPDFPGSELETELQRILQAPLRTQKLVDAMSTVMMWAGGCHRLFAQLSTARRPDAPSTLPLLKSLWKLVDKVHTAVQNLQQFLVSLKPEDIVDGEQDRFALEHFILMGVRYDMLLVDVVNLQHAYLMRSRKEGVWAEREDDPLLLEMREESMLRVRKCLKLSAFYAQLYIQSQDKHLVHHMLMQLEMLPDWSFWAAQRVGTTGGPVSPEYELSEMELDWLQQALELSSYYTPKAAHRLEAFAKARGKLSDDGPRTLEELLRQNGEALRQPVAELQSQYQAAILQQASTYQDPEVLYSRPRDIPPSLQHLPVNEDPHRYYNVNGHPFAPSASEIFVFDDYGVVSSQGLPLAQQPPVASHPFVQQGFQTHSSWMNLPHDFPTATGSDFAREAGTAEEMSDRWLGGQGDAAS